jgi:N-terminal acetyltransferase B complex non-catalytic subunit
LEYTNALADWLEPYHDYIRPPAATVLAEAAKQTEKKLGHPVKGFEISPPGANGLGKKDEEPPSVKEPPSLVCEFFEGEFQREIVAAQAFTLRAGMQARFRTARKNASVSVVLHVATLTQEVCLFAG